MKGKHFRHHPYEVFITSFLAALVIFGTVIWLPFLMRENNVPGETEANNVAGETYTMLWVFLGDEQTMSGTVALHTDTRTLTMEAVGYSPDTVIDGMTLQERYRKGKTEAVEEGLSRQIGRPCTATVAIRAQGMVSFLTYLQNQLSCSLPESLGTLKAGENTLTPLQVADVLGYTDWESGSTAVAEVHAAVVAAVINRYLIARRDITADFSALTSACDGGLHIAQLESSRELLSALAEANDGELCVVQYDRKEPLR